MGLRESTRGLIWVAGVVVLVMGTVGTANVFLGIPLLELTSDPAAVVEAPFYLGAVTMLRATLLAGAAAVSLVASRVIRGRDRHFGEFLKFFGLFIVVFVLDDLFQGHELVLDELLGVPQPATYAVYAIVVLAGAIRYGRLILGLPDAGLLLLAWPCLLFAAVADNLGGPFFTPLVETAAELTGIVCLAFFGLRASLTALHLSARGEGQAGPEPTFRAPYGRTGRSHSGTRR